MRTEHEMELVIFTLEAGNRELKAERNNYQNQCISLKHKAHIVEGELISVAPLTPALLPN